MFFFSPFFPFLSLFPSFPLLPFFPILPSFSSLIHFAPHFSPFFPSFLCPSLSFLTLFPSSPSFLSLFLYSLFLAHSFHPSASSITCSYLFVYFLFFLPFLHCVFVRVLPPPSLLSFMFISQMLLFSFIFFLQSPLGTSPLGSLPSVRLFSHSLILIFFNTSIKSFFSFLPPFFAFTILVNHYSVSFFLSISFLLP